MFVKGQIYNRRMDIHHKYKGQQQGGISTPKDFPMVIIFSGDSGSEYGYKDGWTEDGIFQYTGEGQIGDMQFIKGNKAIRDHVKDGKTLYVFEYVHIGHVRFLGEMINIGYHFRQSKDLEGNNRQAIVFELMPVDAFNNPSGAINNDIKNENLTQGKTLEELRQLAMMDSSQTGTIKERKNAIRIRSEAVKLYAISRANGICELCDKEAPFLKEDGSAYVEVHHIKRLSDGGPDHPKWVAALCPNCHREAHYGMNRIHIYNDLLKKIQRKENKYYQGSPIS